MFMQESPPATTGCAAGPRPAAAPTHPEHAPRHRFPSSRPLTMPIQRLSRTAVAHAALLALCGAAHAQAQPENVPEATLAPVTVNAGAEKENPTGAVVGFTDRKSVV